MAEKSKQQCYDLIGDIHGCYKTLISLLNKLGYSEQNGIYQHPSRKIIFLGDFVDRCSGQRSVINTVRPMIESGAALAVMGNHEYNAIAYYSKNSKTGEFLREHTDKNEKQHKAFLNEYQMTPGEYADVIAWFKTLPLWLDLDDLKVVHACWDKASVERIIADQGCGAQLSDALLEQSSLKGTWQHKALETLLKGKEILLPNGKNYRDKEKNIRHHIRVKWWDKTATTCRDAFLGPESARTHIPEDVTGGDHFIEYAHDAPPVFLGHYWMEKDIKPLADNIACLDYSVANEEKNGSLVAYRWDGEQTLSKDKFIEVKRDSDDLNTKAASK